VRAKMALAPFLAGDGIAAPIEVLMVAATP
jgi:hypothetical protein